MKNKLLSAGMEKERNHTTCGGEKKKS